MTERFVFTHVNVVVVQISRKWETLKVNQFSQEEPSLVTITLHCLTVNVMRWYAKVMLSVRKQW